MLKNARTLSASLRQWKEGSFTQGFTPAEAKWLLQSGVMWKEEDVTAAAAQLHLGWSQRWKLWLHLSSTFRTTLSCQTLTGSVNTESVTVTAAIITFLVCPGLFPFGQQNKDQHLCLLRPDTRWSCGFYNDPFMPQKNFVFSDQIMNLHSVCITVSGLFIVL